jgi:hypothetical protein
MPQYNARHVPIFAVDFIGVFRVKTKKQFRCEKTALQI